MSEAFEPLIFRTDVEFGVNSLMKESQTIQYIYIYMGKMVAAYTLYAY